MLNGRYEFAFYDLYEIRLTVKPGMGMICKFLQLKEEETNQRAKMHFLTWNESASRMT